LPTDRERSPGTQVTAACTVIAGDREIGSPIVDRADVAIVLNPPHLAAFAAGCDEVTPVIA
jgi:hypothetical protein